MGFISNSISLDKNSSTKIFNDVPKSTLVGTLQYIGNNCNIDKVSTQNVIGESKKLATSITEILLANIERELEVTLQKDKKINAKLIDIPTKFPENDKIGPIQIGEIAIFQDLQTKHYHIVNLKDIRSISSLSDEPISAEYMQKENLCSHIVEYNIAGNNPQIIQRYMTSGITWTPNYNINLSTGENSKELLFTSKAIILNDIQDVNCTQLSCIAGYPSINFSKVVDPFTKVEKVDSFIRSLDGKSNTTSVPRSQSISMNRMLSNTYIPNELDNDVEDVNNGGSNSDDLHLYQFQNIFLKKNERVSVLILEEKLSYKDIYHCKINDRSVYSNAESKIEDVWHAVEIYNKSKQPWSTGIALVTKGHQFVCNNQLNYTPVGASVKIDIAKSLLVLVSFEESSPKLLKNEETIGNYKYSNYSSTGKIKVQNKTKENINLYITIKLTGELSQMLVHPNSQKDCTTGNDPNITREIEWILDVKAGSSAELNYTRTYYRR